MGPWDGCCQSHQEVLVWRQTGTAFQKLGMNDWPGLLSNEFTSSYFPRDFPVFAEDHKIFIYLIDDLLEKRHWFAGERCSWSIRGQSPRWLKAKMEAEGSPSTPTAELPQSEYWFCLPTAIPTPKWTTVLDELLKFSETFSDLKKKKLSS